MPVSDSFLEFVLEQLTSSPRTIHHKRMFGGVGIYADERFVALIDDDRLYLKVGDGNRAHFEQENAAAFRPYGAGGYRCRTTKLRCMCSNIATSWRSGSSAHGKRRGPRRNGPCGSARQTGGVRRFESAV